MDDKSQRLLATNNNGKDANIAVLGMLGVGKSALVVRYLTRRFIGDYDPDLEAIYTHHTSIDNKPFTIHILDTAWKDEEDSDKDDHINWADGIMLVYSITSQASLQYLRDVIAHIRRCRADDMERLPMAIVANKCDLIHVKDVPDTESAQLASEINALFFETSASDGHSGVSVAFNSLCKQVKVVHKKREKLRWFLHKPAIAAKLQISQSIKSLAEMKWRHRTSTV